MFRWTLPGLLALNAVLMLVAGSWWYAHLPGVSATGPYNGHFIADVGVGFAASAVGLMLAFAPIANARVAAVPVLVFLGGHALVHLAGVVGHGPGDASAIAVELVGVYLPAWVAWRVARPALPTLAACVRPPAAVVEAGIRAGERRLGVRLDYAREIARTSRATFAKLQQLVALTDARHPDPAPFHLAGLGAALADDCGECVQIHVNLARADGVRAEWLRAVLANRFDELPAPLADAFCLGRAVAVDDPAMSEYRDRLERHYGAATVTALAFDIGLARFYPTLKRALGVARSCSVTRVEVDAA